MVVSENWSSFVTDIQTRGSQLRQTTCPGNRQAVGVALRVDHPEAAGQLLVPGRVQGAVEPTGLGVEAVDAEVPAIGQDGTGSSPKLMMRQAEGPTWRTMSRSCCRRRTPTGAARARITADGRREESAEHGGINQRRWRWRPARLRCGRARRPRQDRAGAPSTQISRAPWASSSRKVANSSWAACGIGRHGPQDQPAAGPERTGNIPPALSGSLGVTGCGQGCGLRRGKGGTGRHRRVVGSQRAGARTAPRQRRQGLASAALDANRVRSGRGRSSTGCRPLQS